MQHLNDALSIICQGQVWVYPEFMRAMIKHTCMPPSKEPSTSDAFDLLTAKENEVAHYVAQGKSNKEIAIQLTVTERTVKAHLSAVYKKLALSDRLSLALWVKDHG